MCLIYLGGACFAKTGTVRIMDKPCWKPLKMVRLWGGSKIATQKSKKLKKNYIYETNYPTSNR